MTFTRITIDNVDATIAAARNGDVASAFALGVAFCGTSSSDRRAPDLWDDSDPEPWRGYMRRARALVPRLLPREFALAYDWFEEALNLETDATRRSEMALDIAQRCVRCVRETPLPEYFEQTAAGVEHPGATPPLHWNAWTLYAAHVLNTWFSFAGFSRSATLTAALLNTGLLVALGLPDPAQFDEALPQQWAKELAHEYHERLAECAVYAATARDTLGTIAAGLYAGAPEAQARWLLCRANQDLYGVLMAYVLDDGNGVEQVGATVPLEVRGVLIEAVCARVSSQIITASGTLREIAAQRAPHLVSLWALLALTQEVSPEHPREHDLDALCVHLDAVRHLDVVAAATLFQLTAALNGPATELVVTFEHSLGHFTNFTAPAQLGDYDPFFAAQLVGTAQAHVERSQHAAALLEAETRRRRMQELLIAGAAHQFGGTIAALTANATRNNERRATLAGARTLNSLLDLFALVSADAARMRTALAGDVEGDAEIGAVAVSALRQAVVALLAERRRRSIDRFLLRYARDNGLIPAGLTEQQWRREKPYQEVARRLAAAWEDDLVGSMAGADLAAMSDWMEHHLVPFAATGFDVCARRFSHDGVTQALLLTVFTELLVNAIKHYDDTSDMPIALAVIDDGVAITLLCSNPASEASRMNRDGGGFGRGLDYLELVAEKLGGQLVRPDASSLPRTTFRFPTSNLP